MKANVNFVIPPYHKRMGSSTIFPLGIGYLISVLLQSGYKSNIINFTENVDDIDKEISLETVERIIDIFIQKNEENPLFWGIGPVTTASAIFMEWIVCSIRKHSKSPIICGGPLPSIAGQKWFFFEYLNVDAIIMGDGEDAIVEVANFLYNGMELQKCSRIVTKDKPDYYNNIIDFDAQPFPYRLPAKLSIRRSVLPTPTASVITMRGCPYSCPFCVSGNLRRGINKKYLKRSVNNIISELVMLQLNGYKSVVFFDDCLFFGENVNSQIETFCKQILNNGIKLKWTMELRPDTFEILSDQSFVSLSNAGCKEINIGFESNNIETQRKFGKKYNWRKVQKLCGICKSLQIVINGTFIIGGINETEKSIKDTIDMSLQLGLLFAHYTPLEIYPGTPLYTMLYPNDEKYWFYLLKNSNFRWNEIIYSNDIISEEDLISIASNAYHQFYSRSEWLKSISCFFESETSEQIIREINDMITNRFNL